MPRSTPAIRSVGAGVGVRVGLQRDVGHPLDRHVVRGVGERAAVAAGQAQPGGERAVELVADEHAVAHQVPAGGGHAVVVEADGGQPVRLGPVAGDVHQRRAVAQRAELVGGGEAGAGVGGLVADGPVVLGGVPDRLVDGQPQVGRVDDQVVAAGGDAGRRRLLGQQLGQRGQLGRRSPSRPRSGTPSRGPTAGPASPSSRSRRRPRSTAVAVSDGRDPDPLLDGRGAGQVGVELVLAHHGRRRPARGRSRRRRAAAATSR